MNLTSDIDYYRLSLLGNKVKTGHATTEEKDEFMLLMLQANRITQDQYNKYKSNIDADALIKAALTVGAVFLLAHLLDEWLSKK